MNYSQFYLKIWSFLCFCEFIYSDSVGRPFPTLWVMLREFVRCSFPLAYFDTLWQGNMLVLLVLGWMELKCLLVVLQPTLYHRIHQESKFDSHRQQLSKTSPTKILNGTPNHQNNNTGKGKKKKVQWIAQQNTLQPSSSNRQAKAPSQYNLERSKHPPEVIIYAVYFFFVLMLFFFLLL